MTNMTLTSNYVPCRHTSQAAFPPLTAVKNGGRRASSTHKENMHLVRYKKGSEKEEKKRIKNKEKKKREKRTMG